MRVFLLWATATIVGCSDASFDTASSGDASLDDSALHGDTSVVPEDSSMPDGATDDTEPPHDGGLVDTGSTKDSGSPKDSAVIDTGTMKDTGAVDSGGTTDSGSVMDSIATVDSGDKCSGIVCAGSFGACCPITGTCYDTRCLSCCMGGL